MLTSGSWLTFIIWVTFIARFAEAYTIDATGVVATANAVTQVF